MRRLLPLALAATLVAACSAGSDTAPAATPGPLSSGAVDAEGVAHLVAAGDIGRCDGTADDLTGALAATLPGVVATLGDTAYEDGSAGQLETCFGDAWGAVRDRIRFAVTGNHDIKTDGGAPLIAYMGAAAAREGRTWFSEDLGAWHVVVLDSNCGFLGVDCREGSDQVRWLREDLAASDASCTLALFHHPRFSSGSHGDSPVVGTFWDALHDAGAELVLNGHDHDYERFAAQDPGGSADPEAGIVEVVAGMGGAPLEGFGAPSSTSLVRSDAAHGVVQLYLGPGWWGLEFLDTDGRIVDQADGACH